MKRGWFASSWLLLVAVLFTGGLVTDGASQELTQGSIRRQVKTVQDIVREQEQAIVMVQSESFQGTGFFVRPDGILLTAYHVIKGSRRLTITLCDKTAYQDVQILAVDPEKDLAVLQLKHVRIPHFPVVTLGDSDQVTKGEEVIAIGNPLGLSCTVSTGIISAIRGDKALALFQTTAAASPGNSGGPLFNLYAFVIGILT
ncbi:MAG: trypsin-like peptidase domain-containing protein [candidate division NC10 bacterium]|nr:trypsin-like peptidase domain-containing protein [candidate division NC10 bacterium]